jgi:uncharacterized phage-like protein YoqJ
MTDFVTKTPGVCVISLTGHRPDKLAGYNMADPYYERLQKRLSAIIEKALKTYPVVECHSGMALGADTVWALAITETRRKYGKQRVKFVAEIPAFNQSSRWSRSSQILWTNLIGQADNVNQYAPQNQGRSYAYILNQRNIGMIQACDLLIAIYDGSPTGGTANGVRDGKRLNKWITVIHPNSI